MTTCAFVFARGGSKGVPGKNIRFLAGVPLIGHALTVARQVAAIDRYFVSTDSAAIAECAERFGATLIERPPALAQDDSSEWLAWQHAIAWVHENYGDFDRFVSLPATAPLRLPEDVDSALDALNADSDIVVTMTPSNRSPWFNMVRSDLTGALRLLVDDDNRFERRQDAPIAYDLTTVAYVSRPQFVMKHQRIWDGRVRGVVVPPERAIDIDTELDFEIADFLMGRRIRSGPTNVE